jgi:hypothetical protein
MGTEELEGLFAKHVQTLFCQQEAPLVLAWDWNLACTVRGYRVTDWATERSLRMPYDVDSHARILISRECILWDVHSSDTRRSCQLLLLWKVSQIFSPFAVFLDFYVSTLHILLSFEAMLTANDKPSGHTVWGMGLWLLACWDCGFESRRPWMSVNRERCLFSGRGLCDGLIARLQESYRIWFVWVWSQSLTNEEYLTHKGCQSIKKSGDKRIF